MKRSVVWACSALAVPLLVQAQSTEVRAEVDSLLASPWVEVSLSSLEQRFVTNFLILLPDLSAEDQEVLRSAAAEAFHPSALRTDLAASLAGTLPDGVVERTLELQRAGAQAELNRIVASYEPPLTLEEFTADPARLDRQRLQVMVALAEGRRQSGRELAVDELLRQVAHEVVAALGADLGPFAPLADDVFDSAYRDRTIRLAIEALHGYEPAPTELVETVVAEYTSEESRTFLDQYQESLLTTVAAAGQRFADLTLEAAPEQPEPEAVSAEELGLCRGEVCGLLVEWQGAEPTNVTGYGVPGDFERFLRQNLASGGYQFSRGAVEDGLTIRLRVRSMRARCEVVSGTDNRTCMALGQAQIDFMGSSELGEAPNGFTVRNRCGADAYLEARGIASLAAARLHYEITTFEGDERRVPSC